MRRNDLSRRLLLGFAGLAALVAVGGCGGGGGSVSPTDFQAEANHVCRDAQDQFDRIVRATPRTADQAEKQAAALVDVSDQALDNLRRIEPPDDAKDAYERYLDGAFLDAHRPKPAILAGMRSHRLRRMQRHR